MHSNSDQQIIASLLRQYNFQYIPNEIFNEILKILEVDYTMHKDDLIFLVVNQISNIYEKYKEQYLEYLSQSKFRLTSNQSKQFLIKIFRGMHERKMITLQDKYKLYGEPPKIKPNYYLPKNFEMGRMGFNQSISSSNNIPNFQSIEELKNFHKKLYQIFKVCLPNLTESVTNRPPRETYQQNLQNNRFNQDFINSNQYSRNKQSSSPYLSSFISQKSNQRYQPKLAAYQEPKNNPSISTAYANSAKLNQFSSYVDNSKQIPLSRPSEKYQFDQLAKKTTESNQPIRPFSYKYQLMANKNVPNMNSSFKYINSPQIQMLGQPSKKIHLDQLTPMTAKEKIPDQSIVIKGNISKPQKQSFMNNKISEIQAQKSINLQQPPIIVDRKHTSQLQSASFEENYFNDKFSHCLCKGKYRNEEQFIECSECCQNFHLKCLKRKNTSDFEKKSRCCWCQLRSLDILDEVQIILEQQVQKHFSQKPFQKNLSFESLEEYMKQDDKYTLSIRCSSLSNSSKIQNEFPDNYIIWINNEKVVVAPKEFIENGKRDDSSLRLPLSAIKNKNWERLHIKFEITNQDLETKIPTFIIGIYLVRNYKQEQFIKNFQMQHAVVEKFLLNLMNINNDIEIEKVKFNLLDPYSKLKMNTPVRGSQCRHAQCFDLCNFIYLNAIQRKYRCPICGIICNKLLVDNQIKQILEEFDFQDNLPEITYFKNGDIEYRFIGEESDSKNTISKIRRAHSVSLKKSENKPLQPNNDIDPKQRNKNQQNN